MVTTVGATLAALPPESRRLVRLMQRVNHGRVYFSVWSGQPDFTRPVRTVRTVKPAGGENGPRTEAHNEDFEVRKEVTTLIEQAASQVDLLVTVRRRPVECGACRVRLGALPLARCPLCGAPHVGPGLAGT